MRIPAPKKRDKVISFGKKPAKADARNLKFRAILRAPPVLPKEYDFDTHHQGVPTPMFGNDNYGDCVIAGRAHQTLRFELAEQKRLIHITDSEVLMEYFDQTGGADTGLVVLDSLKDWRSDGWKAGRKRYKIQAFAQLDPGTRSQIKQAVYVDIGVGLGFTLPNSAITQFHAGKPWTVVSGRNGRPNPRNGHYVYVPGYTTKGPVCVTWGRKQQMSWTFLKKYCDEAYAIIDEIDTAKKKRLLDAKKLDAFLDTLKKNKKAAAKTAGKKKRRAG
jgi:hypothetical protein